MILVALGTKHVLLKGRYHEKIKGHFLALKCSLWGIKINDHDAK